MSKLLLTLIALLCAIGFTGLAAQEGDKPAKPAKASGEIVSCADGSLVISVPGKDGAEASELTFTITESTVITIDGAAGTAEGLVAGKKATVMHDAENVASAVTIGKAPKAMKEGKEKKPKEAGEAGADAGGECGEAGAGEGEAPPME